MSAQRRCNFFDDCGDGSDEDNCLRDPKMYGCHTNVTICGDEAKCMQTATSVYCTCRSGFQQVEDKNACQGLAVAYHNERLYRTAAKLSVTGSIKLNGTDPVVATDSKKGLSHPFSIDIFEDYIYGVTYIHNRIFKIHKFGKGTVTNLTAGLNHATDVVLYHQYKQPDAGPYKNKS